MKCKQCARNEAAVCIICHDAQRSALIARIMKLEKALQPFAVVGARADDWLCAADFITARTVFDEGKGSGVAPQAPPAAGEGEE